jgi:hypothetical protein
MVIQHLELCTQVYCALIFSIRIFSYLKKENYKFYTHYYHIYYHNHNYYKLKLSL